MIVFDPITNHACLAIELRRDGKALYIDQIDGSRIVCERENMNTHPMPARFKRGWPLTVHGPMPDMKDELRSRMAIQARRAASEQAIQNYKANAAKSPLIRHIRIVEPDGSEASFPLSNAVT